jgi:hypothetical protein
MDRVMKRVVDFATGSSPAPSVPPQALREYDVTDEGCARARQHFEPSFAGKEWVDIKRGVRRGDAAR